MLKAFDLENINLDELIAIAMNDPKAVEGESKGASKFKPQPRPPDIPGDHHAFPSFSNPTRHGKALVPRPSYARTLCTRNPPRVLQCREAGQRVATIDVIVD
jgi:hypothetical protein